MNTAKHIFYLAIFIWIYPYVAICGQAVEFPYKVLIGVTGSEKQINISGEWVNVEFSNLSDRKAVETLLGLKWQVLNRNSEGKIFVVGKKLDSYRFDIDGATKVYNFVLVDWYINCPFEFYIEPEGWIPGDKLEVIIKKTLDQDCFTYKINQDIDRFCKITKGGS